MPPREAPDSSSPSSSSVLRSVKERAGAREGVMDRRWEGRGGEMRSERDNRV